MNKRKIDTIEWVMLSITLVGLIGPFVYQFINGSVEDRSNFVFACLGFALFLVATMARDLKKRFPKGRNDPASREGFNLYLKDLKQKNEMRGIGIHSMPVLIFSIVFGYLFANLLSFLGVLSQWGMLILAAVIAIIGYVSAIYWEKYCHKFDGEYEKLN